MAIEHANIADPNIHEPKGAATASQGDVYVANGSGSGTWQERGTLVQGWYDYEDTATAGAPIALTVAGTSYVLTNDGLGTNTNVSYGITGVTNVWNVSTNRFDFSGLSLGDTVDLRIDVEFNSSASNDSLAVELTFAEGTASEFTLPIVSERTYKVAGAHRLIATQSFYLGSTDIKDTPVKITARSDTTGDTVEVLGWFVRVLHNV